ncbi:hypothetical protein [Polaromonas sp.]|uniref:hypothetical protein n=1 Tax=Polaromonas sp. TaxID=1869339 RepID=UPI0032654D89
MIQPISPNPQLPGASVVPSSNGPWRTPVAALKLGGYESIGTMPSPVHTANTPLQNSYIGTEDWDALFCAVQTQLKHAVGEQLGVLPHTPTRSIELAATLVQAVVLDCVGAMDQLHAALKQERSQRPTG